MICLPPTMGVIPPSVATVPSDEWLMSADIIATKAKFGYGHGTRLARWIGDLRATGVSVDGNYFDESASGLGPCIMQDVGDLYGDYTRSGNRRYRPNQALVGSIYGPMTFYLVIRSAQPIGADRGTIINTGVSGTSRRDILVRNTDIQLLRDNAGIQSIEHIGMPWNTWVIVTARISGADSMIQLNQGVPVVGTIGDTLGTIGDFSVGTYYAAEGIGYNGDMKAMLAWNGKHDAATISSVVDYLNARFSVF